MTFNKREKFKSRKLTGAFMRMPVEILECPAYIALSLKARALVLCLGAQFNGSNNGDLALPWSWMKGRGWKSKDTIQRATRELLDAGMIELTRQGGLHCPNLYAFTWLGIDPCGGKLDVKPSPVPSSKWRRQKPPATGDNAESISRRESG